MLPTRPAVSAKTAEMAVNEGNFSILPTDYG